jgi:hypothetical protein
MGLPCLLVGLGRPINANLDQGVADRRAFTLPPDCSSDSQNCSRKLQQPTGDLTAPDAPIRGWTGTNDAKRGPLHHFASKGWLGVRVPLAPPIPLAKPISAMVGDLNSDHLQQQNAAVGHGG